MTSAAFLSKDTVAAISYFNAWVNEIWTTKLENPTPNNAAHSKVDAGKICSVIIFPSINIAKINVDIDPTNPNTDKITDQCTTRFR